MAGHHLATLQGFHPKKWKFDKFNSYKTNRNNAIHQEKMEGFNRLSYTIGFHQQKNGFKLPQKSHFTCEYMGFCKKWGSPLISTNKILQYIYIYYIYIYMYIYMYIEIQRLCDGLVDPDY
jgi:hypothetical protein